MHEEIKKYINILRDWKITFIVINSLDIHISICTITVTNSNAESKNIIDTINLMRIYRLLYESVIKVVKELFAFPRYDKSPSLLSHRENAL